MQQLLGLMNPAQIRETLRLAQAWHTLKREVQAPSTAERVLDSPRSCLHPNRFDPELLEDEP